MALGLIVAGGMALAAVYQQRQAGIEERRAARTERRIAELKTARQRRRAVQEAQSAQASAEALAASTGGGAISSSFLAAQSSIASQLGSNLNFMSNIQSLGDKASRQYQTASHYKERAALFQTGASFAMQNEGRIDNLFA
jgi:regulator of protease activity HflC (stomatin/prohibitin superfamily)